MTNNEEENTEKGFVPPLPAKSATEDTFAPMEGLGHFPMCEDPDRFVTALLPVLEEIRAAGG